MDRVDKIKLTETIAARVYTPTGIELHIRVWKEYFWNLENANFILTAYNSPLIISQFSNYNVGLSIF